MIINDENQENQPSQEKPQIGDTHSERIEREALKLVEKRAMEELQHKALRLRRIGLSAITLCIGTFLITVFSGIGLYYWYNAKIILKTSSVITRLTGENLLTVQIVHGVAASLTLILIFVFIVSFLNFQKVYSETPHAGKTRKVSSFISSTAGLVLIVMVVLNLLTGFAIPSKESTLSKTQKSLESEGIEASDKPLTMEELREKARKYQKIGKTERQMEKVDLNFILHTTLLPVIFGILIFIILFDVYALQKAKFREITPKIKPH